jgi:ABC-type glycerol-3-phosphate transport system permease component
MLFFIPVPWTIALPMVKPALAALAIIKFMWTWNEYFWPLLVMSAATPSMLPLFLLFAVLRNWMIKALTGTGLKAWSQKAVIAL